MDMIHLFTDRANSSAQLPVTTADSLQAGFVELARMVGDGELIVTNILFGQHMGPNGASPETITFQFHQLRPVKP